MNVNIIKEIQAEKIQAEEIQVKKTPAIEDINKELLEIINKNSSIKDIQTYASEVSEKTTQTIIETANTMNLNIKNSIQTLQDKFNYFPASEEAYILQSIEFSKMTNKGNIDRLKKVAEITGIENFKIENITDFQWLQQKLQNIHNLWKETGNILFANKPFIGWKKRIEITGALDQHCSNLNLNTETIEKFAHATVLLWGCGSFPEIASFMEQIAHLRNTYKLETLWISIPIVLSILRRIGKVNDENDKWLGGFLGWIYFLLEEDNKIAITTSRIIWTIIIGLSIYSTIHKHDQTEEAKKAITQKEISMPSEVINLKKIYNYNTQIPNKWEIDTAKLKKTIKILDNIKTTHTRFPIEKFETIDIANWYILNKDEKSQNNNKLNFQRLLNTKENFNKEFLYEFVPNILKGNMNETIKKEIINNYTDHVSKKTNIQIIIEDYSNYTELFNTIRRINTYFLNEKKWKKEKVMDKQWQITKIQIWDMNRIYLDQWDLELTVKYETDKELKEQGIYRLFNELSIYLTLKEDITNNNKSNTRSERYKQIKTQTLKLEIKKIPNFMKHKEMEIRNNINNFFSSKQTTQKNLQDRYFKRDQQRV